MSTRKITALGELYNLKTTEKEEIDRIMFNFSRAIFFAYNRLTKGAKIDEKKPVSSENTYEPTIGDIEKMLQREFNLNSREAKDAVEEARQIKKSQDELITQYISDLKHKIRVIDNKLRKNISDDYRNSLISKREKRQKKLDFYENHKKNKTVPSVIFGGKDLSKKRSNGEISRKDYIQQKYNRYNSRGDKTKGGNPHLRVVWDDNGNLNLRIPKFEKVMPKAIKEGKEPTMRMEFFETPLYIAQKKSKKTGIINGINYNRLVREFALTGKAYYVQIIRKNNRYYVHITIDIEIPSLIAMENFGILGIDTNPDSLALTLISKCGNYKKHWYIKEHKLANAGSTKRTNLAGEVAKIAVGIALKYGVAIAIEDLKFSQNKDCDKRFNRIRHNFAYSKMLSAIESKCIKSGVELIKVHPAYTSKIGLYKYCELYGMDIHNGAAMVIARRAYGFRERVPKRFISKYVTNIVRKDKEVQNEINNERLIKFYSKNDNQRFGEIDAKYKQWRKKYNKSSKNKIKLNYKPNSYIINRKILFS